MRRFIFNASVLSSVFSAIGVVQSTRRGPRDWRLVLMWISWAISVAIAVGTVVEQNRDSEDW